MTMPSKMILLYGVPMFVGCCTILWIYWDRFKKPKKKIFISADCWLCVFDLLSPRQLGFGISMISHRFDVYIDEHFKTRRWALKFIRIQRKIGENGANEMEIVNSAGKQLPITQVQLPRKVIGFECNEIKFIDRNVIAFLHRFRQLFAACPIHLNINTTGDRISELISRNIWPAIVKNICSIQLSAEVFRRLRHFVPSFLNDCPSLRVVNSFDDLFTEFLADDSVAASDGQLMAKWLFTAQPDGVPKVFKCSILSNNEDFASKIDAFKAAFASASSPVNFIVFISFRRAVHIASVVPFLLTNELTREQLALNWINNHYQLLLFRCPIVRDESKWPKWEKEAIGWNFMDQSNRIDI